MRVKLFYVTRLDMEAYDLGIVVRLARLIAHVSFATVDGWAREREAIVDTGSPVSFIPRQVWQGIRYRLYSQKEFGISVAGTSTTAKLASVQLRFHDETSVSPPLTLKAHLLPDDTHPIVLGFEDVLTELGLYSHYPAQTAYLEFPAHSEAA